MEWTLGFLCEAVGGNLAGDPRKVIRGLSPFDTADRDDITFADSPKLLKRMESTRAGAVIVPSDFQTEASVDLIQSAHPRLAFAKIMRLYFPAQTSDGRISPQAWIGQTVTLGEAVSVGPFTVIGDHSAIGSRTILHSHVAVGNNVHIGEDTVVYSHVTIADGCIIGSRVILHPGTVIGADGFGFVPDGDRHYKIPQIGLVQIDDDVEIGACNAIDRATFGKTWIQRGVKTDNLVHIAHNVTVGENTLVVAQVGVAGSTAIGKNVILAGQAGVSGHLSIGDHAVVGPQCGVTRSVAAGEVVSGTPEMPHRLWLRVGRLLPRLPEIRKRLSDLEKRFNEIMTH